MPAFFFIGKNAGGVFINGLDESGKRYQRLCIEFLGVWIAFATFLSLTVSKRKNRCIPCAYLGTAIFIVVIEYCNLFPSFTLFLNCFHFTFGYELIVCSKSTSFMKIICNGLAFICRNKSLFLNLDKIYCFQGI